MRIVILTTQVPFVTGGAEILADTLKQALIRQGHEAEIVSTPFKWYGLQTLRNQIEACKLLDVSRFCDEVDLAIGMKFPTYLIPHPNKRLWIAHQHRMAYDLWDTPFTDMKSSGGDEVRAAVIAADNELFGQCLRRYTISRNVSDRIRRFNGFDSKALRPPPLNSERFRCEEAEDYFLVPSRVNWIKRQRLVLEAMTYCREPVRVVFAGAADHPPFFDQIRELARDTVGDRAAFLGWVTEERKIELYARSLAVVFAPYDEDYGYVTPEAMLASKPVITCSDSGGPLEFVADGETGLVCPIEQGPAGIAAAMDELWRERKRAREMGQLGRERYAAMALTWDQIVGELLG